MAPISIQVHHSKFERHREPGSPTLNLLCRLGDLDADRVPDRIIVVGRQSDQTFVKAAIEIYTGDRIGMVYSPVDPELMLRCQLVVWRPPACPLGALLDLGKAFLEPRD